MLDGWHEFYVLLGTAAAALVALLFVAASIGASVLHSSRQGSTRTFMSPIVFHYTSVLFLSLVALAPFPTPRLLPVIVGAAAMAGFIYSAVILVRVLHNDLADIADRLGYGASPLLGYAAAFVAAAFLWTRSSIAPTVLAAALVLLLLVNIRNAWDLTLSFARRVAEQQLKT